jgi:aspartate/glutamate racemase
MGTDYPDSVNRIIAFANGIELWHSLTMNHEAMSCADAANKRNRLGNTGIPLCDELKSNVGYYCLNGERQFILLHCRGNQKIDEQKVSSLLGFEFNRLPNEELLSIFKCEYGLVNPFLFCLDFPYVEQIFDFSILEDFFPPYTMMTNAGDKCWGIEFKAKQLVNAVPQKRISNIITDDSILEIKKHKIGILTGNSPESGIFLWQKINNAIRIKLNHDFLGDLSLPMVLVESIPEMGLSMELDNRLEDTLNIVKNGISTLCKNGATIIGVACNTTQYFSKEINAICKEYDAEFFSMYDAVNSFLISENIRHFDFFGIRFVTDFTKWSDFKNFQKDFKVEIPSKRNLENINKIAFEVKQRFVTSTGINALRDVIRNSAKTKNIIIALTEISILLSDQKQRKEDDKRYIDTLSLLANKMADRYLQDYSEMLILNQKALTEP